MPAADRLVADAVYIESAINKQINRLALCRRKITYLLDQKSLTMNDRVRLQKLIQIARMGLDDEQPEPENSSD